MTQQNPTFNVTEYELRQYTNPYLTPDQSEQVAETQTRVNEQLDFLAQMLGWNGPNYWGNLPATVDQKRQLLGGSYGVYNSFVIPKIYEIRNWDNKIVIDRLQFVQPGRQTVVSKILVGDQEYKLQSVEEEGDKYVISIGELTQEFFDAIAAGQPLRADIPTYRPAPFNRPKIGISGDYSFICGSDNSSLVLYPGYDTQKQFPIRFPIIFAGAVYYFDQPVYLAVNSNLSPTVTPTYDANLNQWYIQVPGSLVNNVGITAYLVWGNSNPVQANNLSVNVSVEPWIDPSDWKSTNVLNNFRGVWNNKGGDLPYNFAFDALSIHGFSERNSITFPKIERSIDFNEVINFVYYQKVVVSESSPPGAKIGDLWWNSDTGTLAVWYPSENGGCEAWVEIDYRQAPTQRAAPQRVFSNVAAWQAVASTLTDDVIVRIDDISGLQVSDNVLGVQDTLTSPGKLILHRLGTTQYWIPDEFIYASAADFAFDASLLPFKVTVTLTSANGLEPTDSSSYTITNLKQVISGNYSVILRKFYTNTTWELYPDSLLKYIANTSLFGPLAQGEMWWEYQNINPSVRFASIFYSSPSPIVTVDLELPGVGLPDGVYTGVETIALSGTGGKATLNLTVFAGSVVSYSVATGGNAYQLGDLISPDPKTSPSLVGCSFLVTETEVQAWTAVNYNPQDGPPFAPLDLNTVLFYCNGDLLTSGDPYETDDFIFTYTKDDTNGKYDYSYSAKTFTGQVSLPTITVSDSLTTAYRADISNLVFSGITYYMSPNVYNSEFPLRLWKSQDLQVVETVDHLEEGNYINPLLADLNNGPGPENWEKYFIRLPLEYQRNGATWQKVSLIGQDFGYWGSSSEPEAMRCPPEDDLPAIYDELFLYDQPIPDYTYVYYEPYLYSNIAGYFSESGDYRNAAFFPEADVTSTGEFQESEFVEYDPLHNRQAKVDLPVGAGFGDWEGVYVNVNPCVPLTGFFDVDVVDGGVEAVQAPIWDASIYKFPPTCENSPESYSVDANHYKVSYAYFVADASAAEDPFFDIQQEIAWRTPVSQPKTGYLLPR